MKYRHHYAGLVYERNDCTVQALSNAIGINYWKAYGILADAGRRPNHGFNFAKLIDSHEGRILNWVALHTEIMPPPLRQVEAMSRYGTPFLRYIRTHRYTLNQFVKSHPRGRFVVRINRHVLAVVNGVVIDHNGPEPKARVYRYWKFQEAK